MNKTVEVLVCKYCKKPENKQVSPCIICKICKLAVHLDCLVSVQTPGNYPGDVFFDFTCADCSDSGVEIFKRDRISWIYVLVLTLHNLCKNCVGISNNGYFHKHTHIAAFITNNWDNLFDSSCKRRRNFGSSFNGILLTWNNIFFESGESVLNEPGWWKLSDGFSPAIVRYLHSELMLWKQKDRKAITSGPSYKLLEYNVMKKILSEIGFENLLPDSYEMMLRKETDPNDSDKQESGHSSPKSEIKCEVSVNSEIDDYFPYLMEFDDNLLINFDDMLMDFEEPSNNDDFGEKVSDFNKPTLYSTKKIAINSQIKPIKTKSNDCYIAPPVKSLLSDSEKCDELPWITNNEMYEKKHHRFITEYSEIQMLNQMKNTCRKSHFNIVDKTILRIRAKLALRKLKRQRHMPLFNLDSIVSKLAYYHDDDSPTGYNNNRRILDHFQHGTNTTLHPINVGLRLIASYEKSPFISPYSRNLLKPYIWRDNQSNPMWLKLMDELKTKANKNNSTYMKDPKTSLDYYYVRPQHIAAINNMCELYFWPGIDLSDTLLYPEYSCVAMYKKIIVGFAFLVPDVSYNQAYLSFLFTRPEWRGSGIGSFMLYHLTQTCIDKDITLHVSASNSAIFLYQKFGFKVEEFLQEFYDKYFPPESKECKHAVFLRLSRS